MTAGFHLVNAKAFILHAPIHLFAPSFDKIVSFFSFCFQIFSRFILNVARQARTTCPAAVGIFPVKIKESQVSFRCNNDKIERVPFDGEKSKLMKIRINSFDVDPQICLQVMYCVEDAQKFERIKSPDRVATFQIVFFVVPFKTCAKSFHRAELAAGEPVAAPNVKPLNVFAKLCLTFKEGFVCVSL